MTSYTKRLVGETAKDFILNGYGTKEVVSLTKATTPGCNISADCVYTYRRDLRREGYAL